MNVRVKHKCDLDLTLGNIYYNVKPVKIWKLLKLKYRTPN